MHVVLLIEPGVRVNLAMLKCADANMDISTTGVLA